MLHFRTLDYSKTKNRKDLIDTFIYRVVLYDDKMKVLFHLKSGQKNELLLNLIFPDYPDGNGENGENSAKEKETENSVFSFRGVCVYPRNGGDSGNRTHDLLNAIQALYQLSYIPMKFCIAAPQKATRPARHTSARKLRSSLFADHSSGLIAPTGQPSSHAPQSMQTSGSI